MNLKVLHISGRASYDGTCLYPLRLAEYMTNCDSTILFITGGSATDEIKSLSITTYILQEKRNNLYDKILSVFRFIIFLIKHRFDVIHYHSGGITFIILSLLFCKKVIHHLHCGNLNCKPFYQYPSLHEIYFYKFTKNKTTKIAVAEHIADKYRLIVENTENLTVIKNAVPIEYQPKVTYNNTIGYIGQISKSKGFFEINKLLDLINTKKLNLKVIIKGDNKEDISFLNKFKYIVNLIPPSFNCSDFYKNIDLLFFPSSSEYEGTPLVLLEAVKYDVGVIALKTKAVTEIFNKYPLLCDNFSNQSLHYALSVYYSSYDMRKELSKIHERISEEYNYQNMLDKIMGSL